MIKFLKWKVIHGKKLWRTIWFPTANIEINNIDIESGTYKVNIIIENKLYRWAWNYNKSIWLFEVYIFELENDIYWLELEVIVLEKIRNNKNFENIDELKKQIIEDIKIIKNKNNYVLTFGTFDLVHEWHKYFLNEAKKYWDKLVTILATDKNILKFKWKEPKYNIDERISHVKDIDIADIVSVWDEENPMKWIDMYMPNAICLWYDQIWFSNELKKYIKDNKLEIEVIRIKPFKEDIYKSSKLKEQIK